jgi:tetratricopeptide (TPR) repeat protein
MIGDVLTSTAPGEAFTLAVMAALTGTVLVQTAAAATSAITATAAAKTAAGTGSAAIGFAAFLKIFGALGWFVWIFAQVFFTHWITVQNTPTLRARRYYVHTFFLGCQYANLLMLGIGILFALVVYAFTSVFGGDFTPQAFMTILIPLAMLVSISIQIYLQNRCKRIVESDLGLREHVKSYTHREIERRFHRSFIPNILLIETIGGAGLMIPLLDGAGSMIPVISVLGVTGVLALMLYTYYIFGINFMKLCRSHKSMMDYPPLLDDPFEVILGRKVVNPLSIDHWRKAGRLNYFRYISWLGILAVSLLMLYGVHWSNHPVLTVGGLFAIVLGLFVSSYISKHTLSLKTQHLSTVFFTVYNIGCALFVVNVQRGSATLQEYIFQKEPFQTISEGMFSGVIVFFLFINVIVAVTSFVRWIRTKPEASLSGGWHFLNGTASEYNIERFREAIADYQPGEMEDEPETPAFPTRKWFWIYFLYGAILLSVFAAFHLFPNVLPIPEAERKLLLRNNDYTKLIELYPDNPVYYLRRGRMQNPLAQQLADLDKAIQLKPDYAEAYEARAYVRSHAANKETGKQLAELYRLALADVNEAIRLAPDLIYAWQTRAYIHVNGFKDYDAAIADCNEAIRIAPKQFSNWWNRAEYHTQLHRHDAAIADYTKILKLLLPEESSLRAVLYSKRGDVYAEKEDWQQACDDYAEAIRWAKDTGHITTHYEKRYNQLDEKRKAGK